MTTYDVWFKVGKALQELHTEHLDIIEGSGYAVVDGPFMDLKKGDTVHRYVVERIGSNGG